jgi:galactose mutarotase-like enzyme
MYIIESPALKISIDERGAELKSVIHRLHAIEYMWNADPAYWGKTSPVLFPIVGALKENKFDYNSQSYTLPRHGFARDKDFRVSAQTENSITFTLESNAETMAVYPFAFIFSIIYTVEGEELTVTYSVNNEGNKAMLFSVGGHPAFKIPLVEGTVYTDYQLVFEKEETAGRWPISKDGLIEKEPTPLLQQTKELPLSKDLFAKDAVVLKNLQSDFVEITSPKTDHGLRFTFKGFPFLGLWAAPGADFLCIEPWCGIADSVDASQDLNLKEGIVSIKTRETFSASWKVAFH